MIEVVLDVGVERMSIGFEVLLYLFGRSSGGGKRGARELFFEVGGVELRG